MKKLKCKKCNLYFKDRIDRKDTAYEKYLCWNCRYIIRCIGMMMDALGTNSRLNRIISLDLDSIKIRKKDY